MSLEDIKKSNLSDWILNGFILVLTIPALFINLGLFPLISDEPTRGIVTLEMIISGDFINPTINGEPYLNKPPLFNWIQALFINLTNSYHEWVFRLPTVLAVFGICMLIYFSTRKHLGKYALAASLSFMVAGRVLFWDSFMGLIDITYSLVTLGSFIWMIHYHKKQNYLLFFIGSYFLTAIGFLMKGLPSIAFQGLTLLALLIYDKRYRQLFTWQHFAGISLFLIIVGSYYYFYSAERSVGQVLAQLTQESNRLKSSNSNGWWLHLLEFPMNFIYEFAPITILLLLFFSKKVRQATFKERFFRYCLLIFSVNIVIYWISEDMRSRYLFMLVPLLSIILVKGYLEAEHLNLKLFRIIKSILLGGAFLLALSLLVYPFWSETRNLNYVVVVSITLFIGAILLIYYSIRQREKTLIVLFTVLLLVRISFNLFNLPARISSYPDKSYKDGEIKAAKMSLGKPLYIVKDTPINHDASFYITRERNELLERKEMVTNPNAYYLVDDKNLDIFASDSIPYRILHSFTIKLEETRLHLVTIQ